MRDSAQSETFGIKGDVPPIVPDHRLLRRIGRGSNGEVWLALNAMHKWTAVKLVYRRADDDGRAYEREFSGLKRYDNLSGSDGSLMPIKNVGRNEEAGFFYYAMELADDASTRQPLPPNSDPLETQAVAALYRPQTLSEELKRRGRLSPAVCISHGIMLATALEQLHAGGLVHRDVKPSNIIFVNGRLKLADVGLVTATDATVMSLAGTRGFVPVHGAGEATGDLFALGKVLYLMATGNSIDDFPKAILDLESLDDAERHEFAELQAVYDRACDDTPDDRQPSAQALRDELEMLRKNESVIRLRELEEQRKQFEIQREQMLRRRRKAITASLAIASITAVAVTALLIYTWRLRTAHQATVAELESVQLSRMLVRRADWSRADWERVKRAAGSTMDNAVASQAVATMSGLDVHLLERWPNVEATSAAFSVDGRIVLSGFKDRSATLITDALKRIELPVVGEGKVCWAPDGEPLIFLVESNACVLREARTARIRRSFPLRDGEVINEWAGPVIAVNPDGRRLAASIRKSYDGALLLLPGQGTTADLSVRHETIESEGGSRTSPFPGFVGNEKIVVWDGEDGRMLAEYPATATALAFTPNATLLAAGRHDGTIQIFRMTPFQLEATLPASAGSNPIQGLAFSQDRKIPLNNPTSDERWLLASADLGTGVVVWDMSAQIPRSFCRGSDYSVQSVAFHPDGLTLASAGRVCVHFWDVMTGTHLLETPYPGSATRGLAFDAEGRQLVAGASSEDYRADICLMHVEPHRGVMRLRGLSARARKVWFSPDSRLIGALSDEWLFAVWETKTGRLRRLIEVPASAYADDAGLAFDGSGQHLAFAAAQEARLVNIGSGRVLQTWHLRQGHRDEMQFDSEGHLFLARLERHTPGLQRWTLYELRPGEEPILRLFQADTNYTTISAALSVNAAFLMVLGADCKSGINSVRCINLREGRELWIQPTKRKQAWEIIRLDPTGTWCAYTLSEDHPARALVRLADGHQVAVLRDGCQAISPSGREYAGHSTGRLHSLDTSTKELPFATDGDATGDTHTYSPDGRLFAWGVGNVVMVADIEKIRARLVELHGRERIARQD